jgi:hypothetical protein
MTTENFLLHDNTARHCEFPVSGGRNCTLAMNRAHPCHREAVGRGDPSLRTKDMDCRASLAMTKLGRPVSYPRHREAVGRGDPFLRTKDMDCRASLAMTIPG